jgi:hypothetical protein
MMVVFAPGAFALLARFALMAGFDFLFPSALALAGGLADLAGLAAAPPLTACAPAVLEVAAPFAKRGSKSSGTSAANITTANLVETCFRLSNLSSGRFSLQNVFSRM